MITSTLRLLWQNNADPQDGLELKVKINNGGK